MREQRIKRSKSFAACFIAKACILIAILACFMLAVAGCTEDSNDTSSDLSGQHVSDNSDKSEASEESSEISADTSNISEDASDEESSAAVTSDESPAPTDVSEETSETASEPEESKTTDESNTASNTDSTTKTFSSNGMSITLPNDFKEITIPNFTVCYESKTCAIFAIKESFSTLEGFEDYTLEQYGNLVLTGNNLTDASLKTVDGLTYFDYDFNNTTLNIVVQYYSFVYKADDAFWLIQFAINKGDAEKHFDDVVGWAKSVKFSSVNSTSTKIFSSNGMSITLTNEFREAEMERFTVCYDSSKIAVFASKESFTLLEGFEDYTLEQYGDIVVKNNGLSSESLKTTDGLTYFEYDSDNTETNQQFHYYSFVYKADDAFWLIQFAINKGDAEKHFDDIVGWAKSVKFS